MKKLTYIEILKEEEPISTTGLMWGIAYGSLWISNIGYIHQEHMEIETKLLQSGYKYDINKGIGKFDRTNGRTETWFKLK